MDNTTNTTKDAKVIDLSKLTTYTMTNKQAIEHLLGNLEESEADYDTARQIYTLIYEKRYTNESYFFKTNKVLQKYTLNAISTGNLDVDTMVLFDKLYKDTLFYDAKTCFDSYLLYLEYNRKPEERFYLPRRNVLKVIVDDLQDLHDGKIIFLSVALPPRVGKSTLGIFFMTWLMGKYPLQANVMSGHSATLTEGFYREILQIITTPEYNWNDIFSDIQIARVNANTEVIDLDKQQRFPTLTCRSLGGSLTGVVEVKKCLYCDDLISNLEEALSPTRLEKKYNNYANLLKDRMLDGAFQLMIGTRWSVGDIQGRIQQQYRDDPKYRFRVIPALDENGESNFQYPYGLGFSTEYYNDMKSSIDDATWHAKYLGNPYEREGLLFPADELQYYTGTLPDGEPDSILCTVDVAWGGGDYFAAIIAYKYDTKVYIVDVVYTKEDKTVSRPLLLNALMEHRPDLVFFEANNGGHEYATIVDDTLKRQDIKLHIMHKMTTSISNKRTKIIRYAPDIKKFIWLDSEYQRGDYRTFMTDLVSYTYTGKNPNDDAPDCSAMLAELMSDNTNKVEIYDRPL